MSSPQNSQKVFLTVLTAGLVAIIAWVVNQTHLNALKSAQIQESLNTILQKVDDGKEARLKAEKINEEAHNRLEIRMNEIISKREFDIKMQSLEGEIKALCTRMSSVEARMN